MSKFERSSKDRDDDDADEVDKEAALDSWSMTCEIVSRCTQKCGTKFLDAAQRIPAGAEIIAAYVW